MRNSSFLWAALLAGLIPGWAALSDEVTPFQQRARANPVSTVWVGFAVAPNGRVFQSSENLYENSARENAKAECEQNAGRTCRAIAVPQNWNVSVVVCNGGSFVAGTQAGSARPLAITKAENEGIYSCQETFTY